MASAEVIELNNEHRMTGEHVWVDIKVGEHTVTVRVDERDVQGDTGRPCAYLKLNGETGQEIRF